MSLSTSPIRQDTLPDLQTCINQLTSSQIYNSQSSVPANSSNVVVFANVDAQSLKGALTGSDGSGGIGSIADLATLVAKLPDTIRFTVYVQGPQSGLVTYYNIVGGLTSIPLPQYLPSTTAFGQTMPQDYADLVMPPWYSVLKPRGCVILTTVSGFEVTSPINWVCATPLSPFAVVILIAAALMFLFVVVMFFRFIFASSSTGARTSNPVSAAVTAVATKSN